MENFHKCREDQEKEERERREKKRTQKREQKRKSEGPYDDVVGLYLSLAFYLILYNHISLGNDCKLLLLCLCHLNMRCNYY